MGSPYLPVCHIRPLYVPLFMRGCIVTVLRFASVSWERAYHTVRQEAILVLPLKCGSI